MNKFYNNVYKLFYSERSGVYRETKKDFKKAFHTEARRQYDNEKNISKNRKQAEHIQSEKDPSQAGYILRENHVLKPHDSETIRQNIIHIDDLQNSINKIEKELKEHLKKTTHSLSERVLTGHKTAHEFDVAQLSQLQSVRNELNTLPNRILECKETCESAFRHNFSGMKRKSRSRKQNINKCKKRKNTRHSERKREILTKIASDLSEGKTCTKADIQPAIIRGLGKRQKKWANALASSDCNLLDVQAKEELRRILCDNVDVDDDDDESGDNWESDYGERGVDCSHDIEDTDDIDFINDIDGANEVHGTDDIDNGTTVNDWSSSSEDIGPYWESSKCTPYYEPTSE